MCYSDPRVRAFLFLVFVALAGALPACSIVPGQRMVTPPTLDQSGGEYSTEPQQKVDVPITDINLNLLRQMNTQVSQQAVATQT
ncbi:MAG TPA: sugar ABC transporter substrate-binding protein, partial [Trinickia sp.]|nr:sugar ABC transporter substrate-binding protein [Trinickia sp.]